MKTLTALTIALTVLTLSAPKAAEPEVNGQAATTHHPAGKAITVAFAGTKRTDSGSGECEAVCMLPLSGERIDLPWID